MVFVHRPVQSAYECGFSMDATAGTIPGRRRSGMNTILAFIIGLFVGASFGTAIIALLIASRDD